ncbi:hypothetical protein SCP_1103720 [Sparassis crispa]|uniref:Uncharacterized protein n=1 Tax=Sparassis crispa TaxID=139825 RepID=A0A401GZV0_9APHY|nr:hypothetical protein SCP_1103720 [Sparassis crispa]GBE87695.1 hypothetical protein SCP_1103720 [Sparassis crispa]
MNTAALLQAASSPGNPSSPPQPHTSTMSSMQAPQAPASSPTLIRMQTILKPSVVIVTFILPVIIVFMAWLKTVSIHFDVPSSAMSYTDDLITITIHRRYHRGTYKETNPEVCGIGVCYCPMTAIMHSFFSLLTPSSLCTLPFIYYIIPSVVPGCGVLVR